MKKVANLLPILLSISFVFLAKTPVHALSPNELLQTVNLVRTNEQLSALTPNGRLQVAAQAKLADIQRYRYWSHNNPVTNTNWQTFLQQTGYCGLIGENLAKNYSTGTTIIMAWLDSPTHRKNLLSQNFTEVGIAIGDVIYPEGMKTVVVMEFGKPAAQKHKLISWLQ